MPELPEVEIIVRELSTAITGDLITQVKISDKRMRLPAGQNFTQLITGTIIVKIERRAKYILLHLNSQQTIIIHLGMSGRIRLSEQNEDIAAKHQHLIIYLRSDKALILHDPRRFGFFALLADYPNLLGRLGVEPFSKEYNAAHLYQQFQKRKSNIKTILMSGKAVVGIGNIYASEILFLSRILPTRPAHQISLTECKHLVINTLAVLEKAINHGGSTLKDYRNSSGEAGQFQHLFLAYGRKGKPCFNCGEQLQSILINSRSTYYCTCCQH